MKLPRLQEKNFNVVLHVNHFSDGNGDAGNLIDIAQQFVSKFGVGNLNLDIVMSGNTVQAQVRRVVESMEAMGFARDAFRLHKVSEPPTSDIKSELNLVEFLCYLHDHPALVEAYRSAHFVGTAATGFAIRRMVRHDNSVHEEQIARANVVLAKLGLPLLQGTADANQTEPAAVQKIFEGILPPHVPLIEIAEHGDSANSRTFYDRNFSVHYVTGNRLHDAGLMVSDLKEDSATALARIASEEPAYAEKIGMPSVEGHSPEAARAAAQRFLSSNAIVPFYAVAHANRDGTIADIVNALLSSDVFEGRAIVLHCEGKLAPKLQQWMHENPASAPRLKVVSHWLKESNFGKLFLLSPVAVAAGDKSLELAISHGAYPLYMALPWKLNLWPSYGAVQDAKLFKQTWHALANEAVELLQEAGLGSETCAITTGPQHLIVTKEALTEYQAVVRPHYLQRSFWHTFDMGVVPYAVAAWYDGHRGTKILTDRKLNWCELIKAQQKYSHESLLDDPRFTPWARLHLTDVEFLSIVEAFPHHANVVRLGGSQAPSHPQVQLSLLDVAPGLVSPDDLLKARSKPTWPHRIEVNPAHPASQMKEVKPLGEPESVLNAAAQSLPRTQPRPVAEPKRPLVNPEVAVLPQPFGEEPVGRRDLPRPLVIPKPPIGGPRF